MLLLIFLYTLYEINFFISQCVQLQCQFGLAHFVWLGLLYCLEFFLYFYIFEKNTSKVFLFCIEEANVGCRDLL